MTNAEVKINDVLVSFNDGYGGYTFDKNSVNKDLLAKNKVLLHISLGEHYIVMRYNFFSGYQGTISNRKYRSTNQTLASSGYLITDKPVYRPGDTMRVKAFLSNPLNGLPFNKRADFTVFEPNQNFTYKNKLKPVWCTLHA